MEALVARSVLVPGAAADQEDRSVNTNARYLFPHAGAIAPDNPASQEQPGSSSSAPLPDGVAHELDSDSGADRHCEEDGVVTEEDIAVRHEVQNELEAAMSAVIASPEQWATMKLSWHSACMRAVAADMPFGRDDPDKMSNRVEQGGNMGMWLRTHRVVCWIAGFIAAVLIIPAIGDDATDEAIEDGFFKIFKNLTTATPLYIRACLDSRLVEHAVGGGKLPVKMVTV